ncbi:hypothetical protein OKW49_000515 [Paraburkholderia youngii]
MIFLSEKFGSWYSPNTRQPSCCVPAAATIVVTVGVPACPDNQQTKQAAIPWLG